MDASGYLTNSKARNFSLIIYFSSYLEVDKTKINDLHENIDNIIIDINLVLASDFKRQLAKHLKKRAFLLCEKLIRSLVEYGEESSLDP